MLDIYLKTIVFQCSKKYGSPTRVTRLKVVPNMADPISLKLTTNVALSNICNLHTQKKEIIMNQLHFVFQIVSQRYQRFKLSN